VSAAILDSAETFKERGIMIVKKEDFVKVDNHFEIVISGKVVKIDEKDLWILDHFHTWFILKRHVSCQRIIPYEFGYASQRVYLHRLVMKDYAVSKHEVDHINRDGYDNRRINLRFASRAENGRNTKMRNTSTPYKGVTDTKRPLKKRFVVYAPSTVDGKRKAKNIGFYLTAEEAARAYDSAAIKEYGEFAYLNFPEEHGR